MAFAKNESDVEIRNNYTDESLEGFGELPDNVDIKT